MAIAQYKMDKYLKQGRPLSNDDTNIVKGSGDNEDFPSGLPKGSFYRGKLICGAPTQEGLPCLRIPQKDTCRCKNHSGKTSPNPKKKKSPYEEVLTDKERLLYREIKIGTLEEEIKVFKILLQRQIKVYNENDNRSVKSLTSIMDTICKAEIDHYKLAGGLTDEPTEIVISLRKAARDTDASLNNALIKRAGALCQD